MASRGTTASLGVDADADVVFDVITDVERLAAWNERIEAVESAVRPLEVGGRWSVRMSVLGKHFVSVSEVLELDRERRRFVHRSKPEDDNPSHTIWTWEVLDAGGGRSTVRLSWSLHPMTPGRRVASALRLRMIPQEAAASIQRLAQLCGQGRDA